MSKKKLNIIVPLAVYPFHVMVSLGQTDEELEPILKDFNIDTIADKDWMLPGNTQARAVRFSNCQLLIRTKYFPKKPKDYGYLQHEIFHLVTFFMNMIGVKFRINISDEPYAYLVGFLTTVIYKEINKVS